MDFKFPDVGEGLTEGVIVKWFVKEGDEIKRDGVLCEVETDKAVVEIPSPETGVIGKIYHEEGETVEVGEVLVSYSLGDSNDVVPEENSSVGESTNEEPEDQGGVVGAIIDADNTPGGGHGSGPLFDSLKKPGSTKATMGKVHSGPVKVLPAIRKMAEQMGVDINLVAGTGNGGRITKEDLEAFKHSANNVESGDVSFDNNNYGETEFLAQTPMRRAIANHLLKTINEMIPVSQTHFCDITDLYSFRKEVNKKYEGEYKFTFLPFIVKALEVAVKEYPQFNAEWNEEKKGLILKKYVNVAIAVDSEHGLFVPVLTNVETKDIKAISKEIPELAHAVKDRSIDPKKLKGQGITISNYGSGGTVFATPIINHPDTCILGVGMIQKTPKLVDGELRERMILPLTLTYDHRFIDGGDAGRFLNCLCEQLTDKELFSNGL